MYFCIPDLEDSWNKIRTLAQRFAVYFIRVLYSFIERLELGLVRMS